MIPDKVKKILDAEGLSALEFEEGSTPTAETAAAKIGVKVGQIAKSLLFKGASGRVSWWSAPGTKRSRPVRSSDSAAKDVHDQGEETFALTGFWPGGVCPFGWRAWNLRR